MRVAAAAALLLTGCFYLDPIVARPGVTIDQPAERPYRGEPQYAILANFDDPEPSAGSYDWIVFACDRTDGRADSCYEIYTGTDPAARFTVPVTIANDTLHLTQLIKAKLEVRDDHGALATAEEHILVDDAPPAVELRVSAHGYAPGAPIDLVARYADPDHAPGDLVVSWDVTPPAPAQPFQFDDLAAADPGGAVVARAIAGKRLIPGQPGAWKVTVTVRDPNGKSALAELQFIADPDRPPCLAQWQPIVPPSGTTLPISEPTAFEVPLVDDDLDSYPRTSEAPEYQTATFSWSILPPGATVRQPILAPTGNRFELDPAAYAPGDRVEVRVEVFDRHDTQVTCDDAVATCSIAANPACLQRQTWRVEVR